MTSLSYTTANSGNSVGELMALGGGFFVFSMFFLFICLTAFLVLSPIFIYVRLGHILQEIRRANSLTQQHLATSANDTTVLRNLDTNVAAGLNALSQR